MSDELRSTPGPRHEQRRNRGAPSWWSELERVDLPEDDRSSDRLHPIVGRPAPRRSAPAPRGSARIARLRTAAVLALVVVVAALVGWIGIGGGSLRSVVLVLAIFGVPALLAVVTATVIVRRTG